MNSEVNYDALLKSKRKNSRRKGKNFENKIAKILNQRFETSEFSRTPGSGAFSTTHNLPKHLKISGDLITPKDFKFSIECKAGYNDNLQISEFFRENSWVRSVLSKSKLDSSRDNKEPLIILKQDRKEPLVIINKDKLTRLDYYFSQYITIKLEEEELLIVLFEELLKIENKFFFES